MLFLTVSENLSLGMSTNPLSPPASLVSPLPIFQHNVHFTMCVLTYAIHSFFVLAHRRAFLSFALQSSSLTFSQNSFF